MSDKPTPEYIAGQRFTEAPEPQRKAPISEDYEVALDQLKSQRAGDDVGRDRKVERDTLTLEDAHESLKSEHEEARHLAAREAERAEQQQREQAEQEVQAAATWNDADKAELQQRQDWVQVHEEAKQRFLEQQRYATRNADKLSDTDRQYLAQQAQQLQKQEKFLQNASAEVQQASRYKQLQAEQARLFRDVPELKDQANREKLVKWAAEKGIPEDQARAEQRRGVIAQAWREMQKEEKQERERKINRPRRPPIRDATVPAEGLTVQQAKERLKTKGRMTDATNLLAIQRERAKEINDDS